MYVSQLQVRNKIIKVVLIFRSTELLGEVGREGVYIGHIEYTFTFKIVLPNTRHLVSKLSTSIGYV